MLLLASEPNVTFLHNACYAHVMSRNDTTYATSKGKQAVRIDASSRAGHPPTQTMGGDAAPGNGYPGTADIR